MGAYIIARVDIQNKEAYGEYVKHSPRILKKYGGRFIVRGGESKTLEGKEEDLRLVVMEFPSLEDAKAFYYSDEYTEARQIREGAGEAQFIAVDGYPTAEWDAVLAASEQCTLR